MPVVDVPVSALDNQSDLMDWLANELVTNHRFTEYRRDGNITPDNNIALWLTRPQAETFANENEMTIYLRKGGYDEAGIGSANDFTLNVAPITPQACLETVAPQSVIVDWAEPSPGNFEIVLQGGGAFTNWASAGYSAGQVILIANAATPGNDGRYDIATISTTNTSQDTLEFTEVSSGGRKDPVPGDTGDTITVSEEAIANDSDNIQQGFCCAPRSNDFLWPTGMTEMSNFPYLRARLITSVDSTSATPQTPLYFILIVETSTGIYRQLSFGEPVKLVPFDGSLFFSGSANWNPTLDMNSTDAVAAWLQGPVNEGYTENFNSNGNPGGLYSTDWVTNMAVGDVNGRGFMLMGTTGTVSFDAPTHYQLAPFPHYRGNSWQLISNSPSPFSGQSEAYPITLFGAFNTKNFVSVAPQIAPMAIIPDVFLADIQNVDAYSVFQNAFGEKFMVVPMYSKAGVGAGFSEKWGYLIRNPDLVVT